MTQAGSQAAAFYREVVLNRTVWTIADPGGYPQQAIKTPAYEGFEPESMSLEGVRQRNATNPRA